MNIEFIPFDETRILTDELIVLCRYREEADELLDMLCNLGFSVSAINLPCQEDFFGHMEIGKHIAIRVLACLGRVNYCSIGHFEGLRSFRYQNAVFMDYGLRVNSVIEVGDLL